MKGQASAVLSPDGKKLIISGQNGYTSIWDIETAT